MRQLRLVYGKLKEPVNAMVHVECNVRDAYVAEAVFENTGAYLNETELLLLEAQNSDRIHDACTEYAEERGME